LSLDDWYKRAIQYDVNRRRATAFLKGKLMNELYSGSTGKKWNFERQARDPNAMDVDAMTLEERSSLMKKGACFYCKECGHISKECPRKQNRNYGRPPVQKNEYKKYSKKDMAA